eukprot:TRINITY_DN13709_c0_g1_i1.p1 TRINITY_DN13709_c0_g1~~TRINITY_DN13709_c0_g1_i1.p1  ORF type:complete len:1010 (+),score=216.73 TRINITY_DN13709_c0_g1_i1:37-3030(+)
MDILVGGTTPSNNLAVATDSSSLLPTPDPSPSPSPHSANPKFNITISLRSITSPATPFPHSSYAVHYKRGSTEGTTPSAPPSHSTVTFNQTLTVQNCTAVYKDGRAMKKYLVFTVLGDGEPLGSLKLLASECVPGEKSADLPITLNLGQYGEQQCSIGMVVAMESTGGGTGGTNNNGVGGYSSSNNTNTRPVTPVTPVTPSARKYIDVPTSVLTPSMSSDHANPLEVELSPIREVPADQNIQVLVRVRPSEDPSDCVWTADPSRGTVTDDEKSHDFDYIFPQTTMNADIWNSVGPRFIEAVTTGINGTIFMYGQTGSGKTHTMFGKQGESGLTSMLFQNLFSRIGEMTTAESTFEVAASYFEIYNEQLNDLLVSDTKKGRDLKLRSRPDGSFSVPDLTVESVGSMAACQRLLDVGGKRKVMGYSHLNVESSRSHTIFSITVVCTTEGKNKKSKRTATLNFCDLAGSESMMADGDLGQKKECVNINKSLTYLKNVIKQLAEHDRHVSYRNSTLTRILKQSLGGNAKTSIIITIHPGREQQKDSRNSLYFGSMARTVKNRARVNAEYEDANLKQQVKKLQAQLKALQSEIDPLHQIRDDYIKLRDEYEQLAEENLRLRDNATLASTVSVAGMSGTGVLEATESRVTAMQTAREDALLKKINEKDREIIDLKLQHSRELMNKTMQLQKALAEQEQEQDQEETALEIMQKDDRLDQLVYQILSYLHYGTKVMHVGAKGETTRMLLYLITEDQQQHICLCPLGEDLKGIKDSVVTKISVRDLKKVTMGQYGGGFSKAQKAIANGFDKSMSVESKKKRLDVVIEAETDFEAWIQSLNHLMRKEGLGREAEWGGPLDIATMMEYSCLDKDERKLCTTMHIAPIDYINARSQVLNKEGKFVTLFDVRTLSCLDMFRSQKLFAFFMQKGWIGQRRLYFLDTEVISRTANLYDVEYEDDDESMSQQPSTVYAQQAAAAQSEASGYHQPQPHTGYSGTSQPSQYRSYA